MLSLVCVPSMAKKHQESSILGKPTSFQQQSAPFVILDVKIRRRIATMKICKGYLNLQVPQI